MGYLPDHWRLVAGTNKHYINAEPGVDYEATMQQCFKIETLDGEFVADIITEHGELGYGLAKLAASAPQLADACRDALSVLNALAKAFPDVMVAPQFREQLAKTIKDSEL